MKCSKSPHIVEDASHRASLEVPTVFDAVAGDYDADFTDTPLGRMLRRRVWSILDRYFAAGDKVLELACGTGEDAVWLAKRGARVTAFDGSAEMTRIARSKVALNGLSDQVSVRQCSLEEVAGSGPRVAGSGWQLAGGREQVVDSPLFDGVFSNFGGLNAIGNWRPLAEALGGMVRDGGKLVLVVMGPYCPWEIGWHLAHGRPGAAFRRIGGRTTAKVGGHTMAVWYPAAARLRRDFSPWFRYVSVESLGLWLPPTYLGHLVERWPGLFFRLHRLEEACAQSTGGWGDHFIVVFERNERVQGS